VIEWVLKQQTHVEKILNEYNIRYEENSNEKCILL